jgi:hypothetical protein
MRGSGALVSSAMYSVCPEKVWPDRVTASLLRGPVTMASAAPFMHSSTARRT